jgi:hypothetical protein
MAPQKCANALLRRWKTRQLAVSSLAMRQVIALRGQAEAKRQLADTIAQMARTVSLTVHRDLLNEQVRDLLADAVRLEGRAKALDQRK